MAESANFLTTVLGSNLLNTAFTAWVTNRWAGKKNTGDQAVQQLDLCLKRIESLERAHDDCQRKIELVPKLELVTRILVSELDRSRPGSTMLTEAKKILQEAFQIDPHIPESIQDLLRNIP